MIAFTLQHRLAWALVLCCFTPCLAHAQVKLDRLFPPAVAVATETAITAEGTFPNWPPNVECDSPHVSISAGKDAGKLTVKVTDDAPPGVAWVRIHDDQSASKLVPLVLSNINVFSESEPNDKRSDANPIALPTVIAGRLSKSGDSDAYRVSLKTGQTLVVSATANQVLKSPMDAVLQLTDLRGNVLYHSDDARGLDPQIVYPADSDQDLLIRIFAFPETPNSTIGYAGSASFIYTLDVTTAPFVDHVAADNKKAIAFGYNLDDATATVSYIAESLSPPVATVPGALGWSWVSPADETVQRFLPGVAFDGTLPALLFGHFLKADETHHYEFQGNKGTKYRAEVRSKANGFLLDSKLTVTDSKSGKTLASNDDMSSGGYDAGVDFTAVEDGPIDVAVSEMLGEFGPRHFYQLSIRELKPECQLSMAEDHFVVTQAKPLELSVSVNRKSGFQSKIRIDAT
ncbi:MAG: PPC domain-containing protein, partial [Rhodopirellula sp. JB055]|uniref:PPC domain-containing protein n=1 Tax=Rhodopirellula sp. JB055 TaxID=3342846 RepID=UPI00370AC924